MTEKKSEKNNSAKKPLTLKRSGKLELKQSVDTGQVRQSFSHGRSRPVAVEVRRKRGVKRNVEAIDKENSKPDITPTKTTPGITTPIKAKDSTKAAANSPIAIQSGFSCSQRVTVPTSNIL